MPGGRPKKFSSENALISLWREFCDEIIQNGYMSVPTQTEFCRWLSRVYTSADRRTIYNSLNKYFPGIKKEFEQIQSDVIAQGAMIGKYNTTMSIFGLKNWCGWGDGAANAYARTEPEREDDALTKALKEEAVRMQNAD